MTGFKQSWSDERWSYKNRIFPVSKDRFITLARDFKHAAETSFQTPCDVELVALSSAKFEGGSFFDPSTADWCMQKNLQNRIYESANVDDIPDDIWGNAGHVELIIKPKEDGDLGSPFAMASYAPTKDSRAVDFYIQCTAKGYESYANPTVKHAPALTA